MTPSSSRVPVYLIAATAFGICYGGIIASLIEIWSTHSLYSYGFAVPLIAAYIVWTRSQASPIRDASPDYVLGVPLTLAGIAMLVAGRLVSVMALEQLSLVVTLAGVLLLLFGREALKLHWFAMAYLLLMVPIWNYPIGQLQDPSRILSAKIAVNLLHFVGVPALRQETNILLPTVTLAVLRECSGVNQLIALTAMVLPAAYLWLDTAARRVALILFSVVVSYLGNGLRIALVGWLAFKGLGDGDINGSYHLLQGLSVSILGYLAIGACLSLLSKSQRTAAPRRDDARPALPAAMSSHLPRRRLWLDVAVLGVMLAASASRLSATQLDVHLSDDFRSVESRVGDWTMEMRPPSDAVQLPGIDDDLVAVGNYPSPTGERRFTAVDNELIRMYRSPSGARVQLYVGYYHRQEQGRELAGDASGALARAASDVSLKTESGTLGLREVAQESAGTRRGLIFWYDINGRIVADIYQVKGYTLWNALTRRRTNGAVVMIAWEGAAGAEAEAAREQALGLAEALLPVLRRHLPS